MQRFFALVTCVCFLLAAVSARADDFAVIQLRQEFNRLKADYQDRIRALEDRLAASEQAAARRQDSAAAGPAQWSSSATLPAVGSAGSRAFNPDIGVVLQGNAWHFGRDPAGYSIAGFPLGGEAGPKPRGLSLDETEFDFSSNVDDKFSAWLSLPINIENGSAAIDVEEAWIETLGLTNGFTVRFGRFFSGLGYLNSRHAHTWAFADAPLVNQAFLGSQYFDDGIQLRWLAPLDFYLELGAEILRGDRFPAGGASGGGFGTKTVYAHFGGDVGDSQSWVAGLSYLHGSPDQRVSGSESAKLFFNGKTDLVAADFVWKWSPHGNWRQRNFVFQTEAMWRNENGDYTLPSAAVQALDNDQRGFYAQVVYQFAPQWRVGTRFDQLMSHDPGPAFNGTELKPRGHDPKRVSLMLDWSNSEFSRLRLQYSRDRSGSAADNQWALQYIFSIGAHGAHTF